MIYQEEIHNLMKQQLQMILQNIMKEKKQKIKMEIKKTIMKINGMAINLLKIKII